MHTDYNTLGCVNNYNLTFQHLMYTFLTFFI